MPTQWEVYYTFADFITHPKHKFIVVAATQPYVVAFLINSNITEFAKKRLHLKSCHVHLTSTEHPFLSHDSYLSCQTAFEIQPSHLNDFRGTLSQNAIQLTKTAVLACGVLKLEHKQMILSLK